MPRLVFLCAGLIVSVALLSGAPPTTRHEVAITIDDLPVAQSGPGACGFAPLQLQTLHLLEPFLHYRAPITAFVVGRNCPDLTVEQRRTILHLWIDAGVELGNHTFSHPDLNKMDVAAYEADIQRGDEALRPYLGSRPLRYFRYPFLHMGATAEAKAHVAAYLAARGYINAPVTFDNSDWMFAYVYSDAIAHGKSDTLLRVKDAYIQYMESIVDFFEQRAVEVVGREIPQILLMHANRLNSEMAPDLLAMFKRRGYKFITLEQALKDPIYQSPESYAGTGGFSWIHRWSMTKDMPNKGEPEAPKWVAKEYERLRQEE